MDPQEDLEIHQRELLALTNEQIYNDSDTLFKNPYQQNFQALKNLVENDEKLNKIEANKKLNKLRKELEKGDSFLTFEGGFFVRNTYTLVLKVYFQASEFPLKEVIRIDNEGEYEKMRDNYISEKSSQYNITNDFNGEIVRTLKEELNLDLSIDQIELIVDSDEQNLEIRKGTTFPFLITRTNVYNRSIRLPYYVDNVPMFRINSNSLPNETIFFTNEFENDGKYKRTTIWCNSVSPDLGYILVALENEANGMGMTLIQWIYNITQFP